MELKDVSDLIKQKLELDSDIKRAYKLCDFKPTYGLLFEDYIKDADYWGFGDIDLIYGDLTKFFSDIRETHRFISFREFWVSGSLFLVRNTSENNVIYRNSKDAEFALSNTHKNYGFCEVSFDENGERIFKHLLRGENLSSIETQIQSFSEVLFQMAASDILFRNFAKESISKGMIIKFDQGSVTIVNPGKSEFSKGQEFAYYHFVTEKSSGKFEYPKWKEIPDEFYISQYGFHKNLDKIELILFFKEVLFKLKFPYRIAKRAYNKFFKAA